MTSVIASRAEKARKRLRNGGDDNIEQNGNADVATLMSDLRIAAEQRQLLDSKLSSSLRVIGGPINISRTRTTRNDSSSTVLADTSGVGWLTAADLEAVRKEAATTHVLVHVPCTRYAAVYIHSCTS